MDSVKALVVGVLATRDLVNEEGNVAYDSTDVVVDGSNHCHLLMTNYCTSEIHRRNCYLLLV